MIQVLDGENRKLIRIVCERNIVKAPPIECAANPRKILHYRVATTCDIKPTISKSSYRQVCFHAPQLVAQDSVRRHGRFFDVGARDVLNGLARAWSADVKFPKIRLIKNCGALANRATFLGDDIVGCRPTKGQLAIYDIVITMRLVGRQIVVFAIIAEAPCVVFSCVRSVVVVFQRKRGSLRGVNEPAGPLKSQSGLMDAPCGYQVVVDVRFSRSSSRQRLIVGHDHAYVLEYSCVRSWTHFAFATVDS